MSREVLLPDIGDFRDVEVIEVLVSPGDQINEEDALITLESDKATMEVPAPVSGTIEEIKVRMGDKISEGSLIAVIKEGDMMMPELPSPDGVKQPGMKRPVTPPVETPPRQATVPSQVTASTSASQLEAPLQQTTTIPAAVVDLDQSEVHASPSVRRFARELGVDLQGMTGSGAKGRILKEDVQTFVKGELSQPASEKTVGIPRGGTGIPAIPHIDFSKFGEIEKQELSRINKISGPNLHRSWLNVPHVTQFDEADITTLEAFRKSLKAEGELRGVKVTMLSFIMKACVTALKRFPVFNSSLDSEGEHLILKKYYHIGIAVDTPEGLVVPVVREVERKGLFELAEELGSVSNRARAKKLQPKDLQGASFTISSLGGIGGTAFTPIVNAPEVAILGVSRSAMKPVYENGEFIPRLILPLALSYDHRVIDGATGTRFTTYLSHVLSDPRNLLL